MKTVDIDFYSCPEEVPFHSLMEIGCKDIQKQSQLFLKVFDFLLYLGNYYLRSYNFIDRK